MTKEYLKELVNQFIEITTYVPPKDIAVVLTKYSKDFQDLSMCMKKKKLLAWMCISMWIVCQNRQFYEFFVKLPDSGKSKLSRRTKMEPG